MILKWLQALLLNILILLFRNILYGAMVDSIISVCAVNLLFTVVWRLKIRYFRSFNGLEEHIFLRDELHRLILHELNSFLTNF
jgi:hypothetical protein